MKISKINGKNKINNDKFIKYNNFLNVCKINKQFLKIRNKSTYKFRYVPLIRNESELDE